MYPLADAANPPATTFVNVSGKAFNTIHAMDASFFDEVNEVIQEEPTDAGDPETLGLLAAIGIEKGIRFAPDARMKTILAEAAAVGQATVRALAYRCRLKTRSSIRTARGSRRSSAAAPSSCTRERACSTRDGSSFLRDRDHAGHGHSTGRCRVSLCRRLHRLAEEADGRQQDLQAAFAGWHPSQAVLVAGALRQPDPLNVADRPAIPQHWEPEERRRDQSRHLGGRLFGPKAPSGKESNWVQTWPGKGWNIILRLYGPMQPFFDKTWRPSEIQEVR